MINEMQPLNPVNKIYSDPLAPTTKKPTTEIPYDSLPFAFPPSTNQPEILVEKAQIMDDKLLEELDSILGKTEEHITDELTHLNQTAQNQKIIKNFMNIEKWAHEYFDTTKDIIKEGIGFLEKLLPKTLLEGSLQEKFSQIKEIANLSGAYLNSLESGTSGLSLILKAKIIAKSKEALIKLKTKYKKESQHYNFKTNADLKTWEKNLETAQKQISYKDLRKLESAIKELETTIYLEEASLPEQKTKFGVKLAKNTLSFTKLFLNKFPFIRSVPILEPFLSPLTISLSCTAAVLGTLLSGIGLYRSKANMNIYQKWSNTYKDWKQRHQWVVDKTKSDPSVESISSSLILLESMPWVNKNHDENLLFRLLHQCSTFEEMRAKLQDFDIQLDPTIENADDLFQKMRIDPEFKEKLVSAHANFRQILERFDFIIETSQNLLTKRKAQLDKKVFTLKPHIQELMPKIKVLKQKNFQTLVQQFREDVVRIGPDQTPLMSNKNLQRQADELGLSFSIKNFQDRSQLLNAFDNVLEKKSDHLIEKWVASQPADQLLQFYVDHQETLELTTKNALKEMVNKKHELEGNALKFKLFESSTIFSLTTIATAVSVTLAILGLLTIPLGGAGFILLALSITSAAVTLGLTGASYYRAYRQKPENFKTKILTLPLMVSNLCLSIESYLKNSKKKKLQKTAQIIKTLHQYAGQDKQGPEYQKALKQYEAAKEAFTISQSKVEKWNQNVKNLQNKIKQAEWYDFATQSALKIDKEGKEFDTLRAFNEAMRECDLKLLNLETKTLLESQLGLNLENFQHEIRKDPEVFKKALEKFFTLNEGELINFIKYQEERIKAGMITKS